MAVHGGHYSSFLEKLQLPHPLVQRFAVNAIFQRLKSGPAHTNLNSPIGQEAFARCLSSTQPAVVDQTVKEICNLCREEKLSVEKGLQELQSALDSVSVESVGGLVNGIGYLCRLYIQSVQENTPFIGKTGELLGVGFHPLMKSFQTRVEVHQHVLQQVRLILVQALPGKQATTFKFLQPFITFVLMQSLTSSSHVLFARELHYQLSLMTLSCQAHGLHLLRMLISYIQLYPVETTQECEVALAASNELVNVWESHAKQKEMPQDKELVDLGLQLLGMLIGSCHELLSRKVSFYHLLLLVRRVIKLLRSLSPDFTSVVEVHMVSMAYMLALMDCEQEQLLLLDLGLGWLEDIQMEGMKSETGTASFGSVLLFWVFPALHVMSYPSVAVRSVAGRLLQVLERIAKDSQGHWKEVGFAVVDSIAEDCSWGEQHLAVVMSRLVHSIWSEERSSGKWLCNPTDIPITKASNGREWLTCLSAVLRRTSQRTRAIYPSTLSLQQNKGLLTSLCTLVTVFAMHPNGEIALAATECLSLVGNVEPIWGVSLLPVVLFCLRFRGSIHHLNRSDVQLGFLKAIPSLACHSATLPLVIQALQPMLTSRTDPIVQATAIRVLCKTWELTDRAFPHLQQVIKPEDINRGSAQVEGIYSRAVSLRDVCKKDPDRGVDLVLSVQACIESTDPVVRSLGLQSLSLLCKEDVVDFYTAWLVISKFLGGIPQEPAVLESLCMFLRYGALDAAAHPEVAVDVLEILWTVATKRENLKLEDPFTGARSSALKGLSSYEMDDLETICPDKRGKQVQLLLSETSADVVPFCEELVIKVILFEYRERHRGQREAKVVTSKLGKLLKTLPGALKFAMTDPASGKIVNFISEFPGAALLCLSLPPPEKILSQTKREFQKAVKIWQSNYERVYTETAEHLQLNGNLIVAMLALQSWCSFVSRWLYTLSMFYETESPALGPDDNLLKAAKYLLKIFRISCEEGIPRVAESATLALAALCKVLPILTHGFAQEISVFLESRLRQDGHEHMQWSATLALGVVATRFHSTDWNRKSEIVHILLKYAGASDRGIVRGACGLALGLICQSLLRADSDSQPLAGLTGVSKRRETEALVQIVLSLVQLTSETCPLAGASLKMFLGLLRSEVIAKEKLRTNFVPAMGPTLEEDDLWAVVGLIWGLGCSVTGLEQLCCPTLVSALTELVISWISIFPGKKHEDTGPIPRRNESNNSVSFMAAGACLALSTCIDVSSRLEILTESIETILQKVRTLIEHVLIPENSSALEHWPSPLFAALYIGAGNVFATCLQDGSHATRIESIQCLLSVMQHGVDDNKYGTWAQLGAAVGIANVLGAGAGMVHPTKRYEHTQEVHFLSSQAVGTQQQTIRGPLLNEIGCEEYVSSVVKKLLEISKDDQDSRLRSHAGWALAFIHYGFNRGELGERQNSRSNNISISQSASAPLQPLYHMRGLQDFPEGSALRLLCSKLIDIASTNVGTSMQPQTTVSLLRCLERAPRLPALDWGGLIRRCFRQGTKIKEGHPVADTISKKSDSVVWINEVRLQCVLFAIAHAEQVPVLASFLDELCELSRLGTLEASLRNLLMRHIAQLQRIFSHLRLKQLLRDLQEYTSNPGGLGGPLLEGVEENENQRTSFRINLWQGLAAFFDTSSLQQNEKADEVISWLEECMTMLIKKLPSSLWTENKQSMVKEEYLLTSEQWSVAVACLVKTRKLWLLQAFEVKMNNPPESQDVIDSTMRAVYARCQLVAAGCLPVSDLKICRTWISNQRPSGLLVELSWAVKNATLDERREWFLDVLDTAFISPFPLTALVLMSLLASSWSTNALLLPLDLTWAVQDLPLTLPSLLSQPGWASTLEAFVYRFPLLLDRLSTTPDNQEMEAPSLASETLSIPGLVSVLRRTCVTIKHFLPIETRLKLANWRVGSRTT